MAPPFELTMTIMTAMPTLTGFALLAEPYDARRPPVYTVWPPVNTVYRAGLSIRTDGQLDEPAWFSAPGADEVKIPLNFANISARVPLWPGDMWKIDLNPQGGKTNLQYSRCSPAIRRNGSGTLLFSGKRVRFGAK